VVKEKQTNVSLSKITQKACPELDEGKADEKHFRIS